MMELVSVPSLIAGAVIGAVVMYFVYHNNQALMNKKFDQMKAEFDKTEKELRAKAEELQIEQKVRDILAKMGVQK